MRSPRISGVFHESRRSTLVENGDIQVNVARARRDQSRERGARLDVDAIPAAIVKKLGDRTDHRIEGTYIDVKSMLHIGKYPVQQHVFEVLRVADQQFARRL